MFYEKNHITRDVTLPSGAVLFPPSSRRLTLRFLWYIAVPSGATLGLLFLLMSARAGGALLPQPDIFAPYRAFAPGRPFDLTNDIACSTVITPYQSAHRICILTPEDAPFERVSILIEGERINGITFRARNMRLVELVSYWGTPDFICKVGGHYEVGWRRVAIAVELGGDYSLQAPVQTITTTSDRLYDR